MRNRRVIMKLLRGATAVCFVMAMCLMVTAGCSQNKGCKGPCDQAKCATKCDGKCAGKCAKSCKPAAAGKKCDKPCSKPCGKKTAKKCGPNCTKPCCAKQK
ncbi:MAG: hypothetical protein GY842_15670 [bacterium]|nr:hypothetical protein [bacterium]